MIIKNETYHLDRKKTKRTDKELNIYRRNTTYDDVNILKLL